MTRNLYGGLSVNGWVWGLFCFASSVLMVFSTLHYSMCVVYSASLNSMNATEANKERAKEYKRHYTT